MKPLQWLLVTLALAGCAAATPHPDPSAAALVTEEFRVTSDPGVEVYVRNKHLRDAGAFAGERIVLFVHGATFASAVTFDLQLGGTSWMEYIARRGYDVYYVDVRGYGKSHHRVMDSPARDNPPLATTEEAARDVAAAVEFIRRRRGVAKINLLAWSWGTRVMLWYASGNSDKIEKLALYAPGWIRKSAALVQDTSGTLGAYRVARSDGARDRWLTGISEEKKAGLIPPGWYETWDRAVFVEDIGGKRSIRAPNGILLDNDRYWTKGIVPFKAQDIRVPVLLIRGEWDVEAPAYMSQELSAALVNVPYKRYVELGEASHFMMFEKNRMGLFREVQLFLDEQAQAEK